MHLRNSLFSLVLLLVAAMSVGAQAQRPASPPNQQRQSQPAPSGQQGDIVPLEPQSQQPAPPPPAQQPQDPRQQGNVYVFTTKVEEVQLHATVVDDKGRLVTTLGKDAFTVYEDGKPVPITSFRHEDIPVSLGIIIDNSGSMRDKRPAVNAAAINLVKSSNREDEVFIVNFNDEYYLDQDFTNQVAKLQEGLEHIESRGGTALYDAVIASADHLKKNAKLDKKVLLVVTDGEDNSSRESLEQAVRRLQEEGGPTVYTIGIQSEEHSKRARRALQALSEQTGGLAFFPRDASEVGQISQTIARDIRNQYTIGYKKNPNAAPGYRTVRVTARANGYRNLQVRTLSGYFANQDRVAAR